MSLKLCISTGDCAAQCNMNRHHAGVQPVNSPFECAGATLQLDAKAEILEQATICFASPGLYQLYGFAINLRSIEQDTKPPFSHVGQKPIFFYAEHS